MSFWDRLFRPGRRDDTSPYIPPQQPYGDPASTGSAPDPGNEHGDPGQPGEGGAGDPGVLDPGGGGDSGGGDGGGGGNGGGGGD